MTSYLVGAGALTNWANLESSYLTAVNVYGGPSRIRTDNPLRAKQMLSHLELWAHIGSRERRLEHPCAYRLLCSEYITLIKM